jgi:flagellar protein FliS
MQNGFDTYQKMNTMGMSQLDLILTVYRGAIDLLEQSKTAFLEDNLDDGRTACEKARKFIVHLYTTLDMEKGEEIAAQLGQLYAFMIEQIDLAIANKSQELLGEVIGLLNIIMDGWKSLKADETQARATEPKAKTAGSEERELKAPDQPVQYLDDKRLTISA